MFELFDEIGKEHVKAMRKLVACPDPRQFGHQTKEGEIFCIFGDIKERELSNQQKREMADYWPDLKLDSSYITKPVRDKLVDLGLAETEHYGGSLVYGGEREIAGYRMNGPKATDGKEAAIEGKAPGYAEVHVVRKTQRGTDFLDRRILVRSMSVFRSKVNKWLAAFVVIVSIVWQATEAIRWLLAQFRHITQTLTNYLT